MSLLNNYTQSNSGIVQNNKELFRQISNQISDLAAEFSINIVPYYDKELLHFSKLDLHTQAKVLHSLNVYLNIYSATLAEGSSALDSSRVVWNALAQLGYRPTSDLFSHIENGNIIEIHDDSLVQVFRNINFFKYCSYSLEDLYCHQLGELYVRNLEMETELMSLLSKIYTGKIKSTTLSGLKTHIIKEKISEKKLQVLAHIKYIVPLYSSQLQDSSPKATIVIENAELLKTTIEDNFNTDNEADRNNVIPLSALPLSDPATSL